LVGAPKLIAVQMLQTGLRSRIARCAIILHVVFFALALCQMPTIDELTCDEAVQHSVFDRPVAGRYFYYNYSAAVTHTFVLVDLPSLGIADTVVAVADGTGGGFSIHLRSWINALAYALAIGLQWILFGALGSTALRRWVSRLRDATAPPN
jgi:hypothetical protein